MSFDTQYINEFNPAKKNADWADKTITELRVLWKDILNPEHVEKQRKLLAGKFVDPSVKEAFSQDNQNKVIFSPQKHLEKIRNILIGEIVNAGIDITVNAIDPLAAEQKHNDKELLQNRSTVEETLTYLGSTINLPGYKMGDEFDGNIEQFDTLGLDEQDANDINYFFQTHYKLKHEATLDSMLIAIIKFNRCIRDVPDLCNDMITCKTMAVRSYVDEINGTINTPYLDPVLIKAISGKKKDYSDAVCVGLEEKMTVRSFLSMVGSEFNHETDWQYILQAVNSANNFNYTQIVDNSNNILYGQGDKKVTTAELFSLYVDVGYIEWKSLNAKQYKFTDKSYRGNPRLYKLPYESKGKSTSAYTRKFVYDECTYKAYYLSMGANQQKVFKFGKLPYQYLEGAEDGRSSFSICIYKEAGPSITEIAEPHIRNMEHMLKKREYLIKKAKEDGIVVDIDSIYEIAMRLSDENKKVEPMDVVEMMSDSPNKLFARSENNIGGSGVPLQRFVNGLSQAVSEFTLLYREFKDELKEELGFSPLRDAYAPQPREAVSLQMNSLNSSKVATQYLSNSLHYVYSDALLRVISYIQAIVKFKEVNKMTYNYLVKLVGHEALIDIEKLGDCSLHRYGFSLEPFNRMYDRQELKMFAVQAFNSGQIDFAQLTIINAIDSPKKASLALEFFKRKSLKEQMQQEQQKAQIQQQSDQAKHQMKLEEIQTKGKMDIESAEVEGEHYHRAHTEAAEIRNIGLIEAKKIEERMEKDKINATSD